MMIASPQLPTNLWIGDRIHSNSGFARNVSQP